MKNHELKGLVETSPSIWLFYGVSSKITKSSSPLLPIPQTLVLRCNADAISKTFEEYLFERFIRAQPKIAVIIHMQSSSNSDLNYGDISFSTGTSILENFIST